MKPFRQQCKECKANGNLIEIDISEYKLGFPQIALVCLKHKTVCYSKVCFEERNKEGSNK